MSTLKAVDGLAHRSYDRVLRGDEHGDSRQLPEPDQDPPDALGVVEVQSAGRLIGKDDVDPTDQESRDGQALLLSARQRGGLARRSDVAETDLLERALAGLIVEVELAHLCGKLQVLTDGQKRNEAVVLVDEPDSRITSREAARVRDSFAVDGDGAAMRSLEPCDGSQQCRLTAATRPGDGDATTIDIERKTVDGLVLPIADSEIADADHEVPLLAPWRLSTTLENEAIATVENEAT
ncbi:MAG TPA: hypothetical protein PL137_13845, partial [Nocardioides sp.]